jgi:hypothetical protein
MAEESEHLSSDRQATWVALRTLRQRPTLVGRTEEGTAVYEIRSVRLVLSPGAAHFRRLSTCARCERDVPGSPVLAPADLNRPPSLVFCDRCARSPDAATPEIPRPRDDPPAPAPAPAPKAPASPVVTDASAGERQRLSEQVADLLRAQNAELVRLSASVAGVRAEMRQLGESNQALARGHQELDQRMVGLAADVAAHPDAMVEPLQAALDHLRSEIVSLQRRVDGEAAVRSEVGALAESTRALAQRDAEIETTLARELVDLRASVVPMIDATAQPLHATLDRVRAEIASLQQRMDDEAAARPEVDEFADSSRALANAQAELDRKVHELAAQVETARDTDIETRLAREFADLRASLAPMVDATAQPLHAALDQLRSQIASLQQRIDDEAAARSEIGALVELSRRDLGELAGQVAGMAGDDVVLRADVSAKDSQLRVELADGLQLLRAEIASVEQRSRSEFAEVATLLKALRKELTEAVHDVAHETLMAVAEPLRDLTKAREEFERRLESLQQKVQEDQRRVAALDAAARAGASRLQALEQQLHTAMQRLIRQAGANPAAERRPSGALLDSLDRQLREAEERLGQL